MRATVAILCSLAVLAASAQPFFVPSRLSKVITGLHGCWLLYESTGTRYDRTGYNNNLTDNGGVTRVAVGSSYAASFAKASSQYLSIANNSSLQTGGKSFEVTFWFNPTTITGVADDPLINKGNNAGTVAEFYTYIENTTGKPTIQIYDDTGAHKMAGWGSSVTTSTRYFFDAYYDSVNNLVGIAINGGSFVTSPTTAGHPTANTTQAFAIGANSDGGSFYNGTIQWPTYTVGRTLTAQERLDLYNNGLGSPWARF